MYDTGKISHHHAEAVVERNRDQQTIAVPEAHAQTDEVGVVENIAVRQRRALGKAGGA